MADKKVQPEDVKAAMQKIAEIKENARNEKGSDMKQENKKSEENATEQVQEQTTEQKVEEATEAAKAFADKASKKAAEIASSSAKKLKEIAGEGWEDVKEEVSSFFSRNKTAMFKQFAVAGAVFAAMMFLNVPALWSFIIAATGLSAYWLILFKNLMLKKLGTKPSEAQVILYTIIGVFGIYNPFHLDLVHFAKWAYHLESFGTANMLFTVNMITFFVIMVFFWYYSARYMAETSYQSLGKWKAILVASSFVIVIGVVVYNVIARTGLDGIAVWYKPIILAIQVALAYVIYDSFGFAKRHFKRATIVSSDSVEGDTINVEKPGENQAGNDADEFVQNEAATEFEAGDDMAGNK